MSELQKYKQVYDRSLYQYVLIADEDGDLYTVDDVDARLAADAARIELLQRSVEWLSQHSSLAEKEDGTLELECLDASKQYWQFTPVPAEFADIIKE